MECNLSKTQYAVESRSYRTHRNKANRFFSEASDLGKRGRSNTVVFAKGVSEANKALDSARKLGSKTKMRL